MCRVGRNTRNNKAGKCISRVNYLFQWRERFPLTWENVLKITKQPSCDFRSLINPADQVSFTDHGGGKAGAGKQIALLGNLLE